MRPSSTPAGDKPPHYIPLSPPLWIPAPYRGSGCAFAGKTKWGRRVDVGGGIAVGVLSRDVSAWIPAFAGMTKSESGTCFRTNDELRGGVTSWGTEAFRHTRGRVTSFPYQCRSIDIVN